MGGSVRSDAWRIIDARHNRPRIVRVLTARGRDAVDVALTTSFGTTSLKEFSVWSESSKMNSGRSTCRKAAAGVLRRCAIPAAGIRCICLTSAFRVDVPAGVETPVNGVRHVQAGKIVTTREQLRNASATDWMPDAGALVGMGPKKMGRFWQARRLRWLRRIDPGD